MPKGSTLPARRGMVRAMGAEELLDAWRRHLRGRRLSAATIRCYRSDVQQLLEHCGSTAPERIDSHDIESFLAASARAGFAPATVERRRRSVRQFYRFLERRGLVDDDPAASIAARPAAPVPVLDPHESAALLGACCPALARQTDHSDFETARDLAVVLVLLTTGIRTSELVGLRDADVHLDRPDLSVIGRNDRPRSIDLLPTTAEAMFEYAGERRKHPASSRTDRWWLGSRGPMTASGLRQMLSRRCREAGVRPVSPAAFRRNFARERLEHGMRIDELMKIGGWSSARTLQGLADPNEPASVAPLTDE